MEALYILLICFISFFVGKKKIYCLFVNSDKRIPQQKQFRYKRNANQTTIKTHESFPSLPIFMCCFGQLKCHGLCCGKDIAAHIFTKNICMYLDHTHYCLCVHKLCSCKPEYPIWVYYRIVLSRIPSNEEQSYHQRPAD